MFKHLDELAKAVKALDGGITQVNFDPSDPSSVRAAVTEMERAIDRKVSRWRSNPYVADIVKELKSSFRKGIQQKARQAQRSC